MSRLLGFVDDSPPWFSHTETKKTNGDSKRATQQVGGWIFPWNLKAGIFEKISRWFWNLSLGMWRDSVAIFVVSDFQFQWSFRSHWSACIWLGRFFFSTSKLQVVGRMSALQWWMEERDSWLSTIQDITVPRRKRQKSGDFCPKGGGGGWMVGKTPGKT